MALSGSEKVAPATRERIIAVAQDLGYTRDLGAASLASGCSPVLGVVLPDLRNPFFELVVRHLDPKAAAQGLVPFIATALDSTQQEALILERLREMRVVGVIMVSPVQPIEELERAAESLPIVLIGADVEPKGLDIVHVDEDEAAKLIMDHLVERGWTSVISLADEAGPGGVWVERRQRAMREAATRAHLPFHLVDPGVAPVAAGEGLHRLLDSLERPAVVAHNDLVAVDALAAVRKSGRVVGRDVAIIGFDDTHLASRSEFSLTSVSQDPETLVELAMTALAKRQTGTPGAEHVTQPTLVARSSS